jgi:anthraniloyl-CoA monooxygenase
MRINIVGGGPAGLYFAILAKRRDPAHEIRVFERDGSEDTFGWGIVFSERTYALLRQADPESHREIAAASETWDSVDTVHRGETVSVRGNAFSGVARLTFLQILHRRCRDLGVDLHFRTPVHEVKDVDDGDLLIGADGANSLVRRSLAEWFLPSIDVRQNRYVWLGTPRRFEGLSMIFRESAAGLFIAHAYRFQPAASTFIVECGPETWRRSGLERMSEAETCAYLAFVFADDLGGQPLLSNNFLRWLNFPLVKTKRWYHGHTVLVGDAAHTAHFSIGSGTKLALEDAIALCRAVAEHGPAERALPAYEQARKPAVDAFQEAALASLTWLEGVEAHLHLAPLPFTYRLQTRSRRVGLARLRQRDPAFAEGYERWRREQRAGAGPIPADFLDLFRKPAHGHLATTMPDGTPQVTPVWVDYDGRHVLINSAAGRRKDLNMGERPQVAVEISDPENPNRYLAVRGPVVEVTEAGADGHLDRLARRYLGRERYPEAWRFPGEVRRIYRIEPRHVTTWDPFG